MSQGDERGYGGHEPGAHPDDAYSTLGGTRQTRTRLPDGDEGDGYGRRPARNSRSLIMVVGVVVLLVAAIAFANQGGGGGSDGGGNEKKSEAAGAGPTAATGTKPVQGKNGSIASGFAHDEQGAQSAAANYAVALGSAEMFNTRAPARHRRRSHRDRPCRRLQTDLDKAYSARLPRQASASTTTAPPRPGIDLRLPHRPGRARRSTKFAGDTRDRRGLVHGPVRPGGRGLDQPGDATAGSPSP